MKYCMHKVLLPGIKGQVYWCGIMHSYVLYGDIIDKNMIHITLILLLI